MMQKYNMRLDMVNSAITIFDTDDALIVHNTCDIRMAQAHVYSVIYAQIISDPDSILVFQLLLRMVSKPQLNVYETASNITIQLRGSQNNMYNIDVTFNGQIEDIKFRN